MEARDSAAHCVSFDRPMALALSPMAHRRPESARREDTTPRTWYPVAVSSTEDGSARWTGDIPMSANSLPALCPSHAPWNKGHIIGQKRPLLPSHVWSIGVRLEMAGNARDLALFNMAILGKLEAIVRP